MPNHEIANLASRDLFQRLRIGMVDTDCACSCQVTNLGMTLILNSKDVEVRNRMWEGVVTVIVVEPTVSHRPATTA